MFNIETDSEENEQLCWFTNVRAVRERLDFRLPSGPREFSYRYDNYNVYTVMILEDYFYPDTIRI